MRLQIKKYFFVATFALTSVGTFVFNQTDAYATVPNVCGTTECPGGGTQCCKTSGGDTFFNRN